MAELTITNAQMFTLAARFRRGNGSTVNVTAVPVWASEDGTLLSLVAAPDGMSAEVSSVGGLSDTARIFVDAVTEEGSVRGTFTVAITDGGTPGNVTVEFTATNIRPR